MTSIVWIVRCQKIKESWQLSGFNFVYIVCVRLYNWNSWTSRQVQVLYLNMLFRVCILLWTDCLKEMIVNNWYFKTSVDALRKSRHFRVIMPVEFLPLWNDDEEQRKFLLAFYGKSDDARRSFDLTEHFIEFRHPNLFYFWFEKFKMVWLAECRRSIICVFVGYGFDQTKEGLEDVAGW